MTGCGWKQNETARRKYRNFMKFTDLMCDGHFARFLFANFEDFPGDLLVLKNYPWAR